MIRCEWKKLLIKRKGWILILIFLIVELAGTLLFTQPYDKVLEDNRLVYESYLSQVEGSLTDETQSFLEAEMERLNSVHQHLEQLKLSYYSGEVAEAEYRESFDSLSEEDAKYTGFSKLYNQYIFVRESNDRSFLYTGGWEVLLTNQNPDYLFLLVLIILLTPIFCEEYACRMNEILLTQKRSSKYQVFAKAAVALTLTSVLLILLQSFTLIYCAARFGLPNSTFSLQSIRSFGTTVKQINLWQAFGLQFALKLVGYLYAAIVILFLSVLLKKFALTLMTAIGILPLPLLTVDGAESFLSIPGPWALTVGNVYLNGGKNELNCGQIGLLLLLCLGLICAMLYFIFKKNTNWQLKKRRHLGVVVLCVAMMLLTGCVKSEETVIYNRVTGDQYETDTFIVMTASDGSTITDKATGNIYAFPLNPLEGEIITCGRTVYGKGDNVWYLRTTTHYPSAGWDTITTDCDLVKLELDTMKEYVVYQWNEETDWFFGLLDRNSKEPDSFSVELLFIHGRKMYYVDTSQATLNCMDLNTGKYEVILSEMYSTDVAYDGLNLYYLDSYSRLIIHNVCTDIKRVVDEVVAKDFLLTDDGILFQNRRDQLAICSWNNVTNEITKISGTDSLYN